MRWAAHGADWPLRDASRFVRAGGLLWHVQCLGEGPVVLLLHGTGSASMSWRGLATRLAARHTVVIPDLPGHGFTEAPAAAAMSLPGQASLLASLLRALDLSPETVIGHSAGAAIGARLVLDGAAAPRRLVSVNGAFVPLSGPSSQVFPAAARLLAATGVASHLFALHATNEAWMRRFLANTGSRIDETGQRLYGLLLRDAVHVGSALAMMARWRLEPLWAALPSLPTALVAVAGDGDRMVPPGDAASLASRVPGARLHRLPGLGHLAHEERPDLVADLLAWSGSSPRPFAVAS